MARVMMGTWVKAGRLWRAWHKGKLIQRSCKQLRKDGYVLMSETKEGSYLAFNAYYHKRVGEIDEGEARKLVPISHVEKVVLAAHDTPAEIWPEVIEMFREVGVDPAKAFAWLHQVFTEQTFVEGQPLPDGIQKHLPADDARRLHESVRLWHGAAPAETEKTIGAHVEAWLAVKAREVAMKNMTPERAANDRNAIRHFVEFIGPDTTTEDIDETTVDQFYRHVTQRARLPGFESGWSRAYVREVYSVFRQFVRWAGRRHYCRVPSNLDEKKKWKTAKRVTTWEVAEFKRAVEATSGKLRLGLLLMANCGMYAKDVARIRKDQVDWLEGTITWKRGKTEDVVNVPTVTHKLWPTTFALLKKHVNQTKNHPELVVVNRFGQPYVTTELLPNGRLKKRDGFKSHWVHVRKKLGIARPLLQLRKLGPSLLKGSPYASFVGYFLEHSAKNMADAHYIDKQRGFQVAFDEAVTWLGRQLGQVPDA
jgi:integrase